MSAKGKSTPGPWVAKRYGDVWKVEQAENAKRYGMAVATLPVAEVEVSKPGFSHPDDRADAHLIAAAPDGLAAAELALGWLVDPDENATEQFERIAEEFYRDTGFMRPGKSVPLAMGGQDEEARRAAWVAWVLKRSREVRAALLAYVAKARGA